MNAATLYAIAKVFHVIVSSAKEIENIVSDLADDQRAREIKESE
jgi:hypothetical protein